MQVTEKIKDYCRTFPENPLNERITEYHPMGFKYYHLQPYKLLPPWASGITTVSLTYYNPHGLQVLPPSTLLTATLMGFRYYHLQPYKLLPP